MPDLPLRIRKLASRKESIMVFGLKQWFRGISKKPIRGNLRSKFLLEQLEDRIVPANKVTFILDYSPDSQTPDDAARQPGKFRDMFGDDIPQTSLNHWRSILHTDAGGNFVDISPWNGQTWAANQQRLVEILDFNGDGSITKKDALGDKNAATSLGRAGAEAKIGGQVKKTYFDPITATL